METHYDVHDTFVLQRYGFFFCGCEHKISPYTLTGAKVLNYSYIIAAYADLFSFFDLAISQLIPNSHR